MAIHFRSDLLELFCSVSVIKSSFTIRGLPKTRSFDNLPSACEAGGSLAPNRRSSDPSLNEKWQDHCRSMELNIAVGPEGGGRQDQGKGPPAGGRASNPREVGPRGGEQEDEEDEEGSQQDNTPTVWQKAKPGDIGPATDSTLKAELLVEVGVAAGQMENILHEATKEESGAEDPQKEMKSGSTDKPQQEDLPALPLPPPLPPALPALENKECARDHNSESPGTYVAQELAGLSNSISRVPILPGLSGPVFRTITNGYSQAVSEESNESESHYTTPQHSPPPSLAPERLEDRASLMESSTETLTEEGGRQEGVPTTCLSSRLSNGAESPLPCPEGEGSREAQTEPDTQRTLNGGHRLSQSALLPNPAGDFRQEEPVCNGEVSEAEPWAPQLPRINGHYPNGERISLSRQMSAASCGSQALRALGSGNSVCQHRCPHGFLGRPSLSPEQPARSHLDDDGLAVYNDIIQQRLRQIEAGHQLEVETLKKQVQELWSRLESQHFNNSLRINGDTGDEVTSTPDSENNLDQSCLSRCSTELFSEASWEQVDKQDTEVTRWYPDHLAPQCYRCESRFWLASRKHHCRYGNLLLPQLSIPLIFQLAQTECTGYKIFNLEVAVILVI
ncbi:UNVERIFIED_CONTAM: hypothetical protein FKN15_030224 [Acipenser sinensis]